MQRRNAFTLIELLVVIAIIAILAAILFPVFAQAKASAKTSATLSNTKQTALGVLMYASDNDDRTPPPYDGTWFDTTGDGWNWRTWAALVYPYTKNANIYNDAAVAQPPMNFGEPGLGANWTPYTSLGCNEVGLFAWWTFDGTDWTYNTGRTLTAQNNIAQRAMFTTNRDPRNRAWGFFFFTNWLAAQPNTDPAADQNANFYRNTVWTTTRDHRNNIPTSFADGHSKVIPGGKVFIRMDQPWDSYDKNYWGNDQSATD